jgi:hypothetical protein
MLDLFLRLKTKNPPASVSGGGSKNRLRIVTLDLQSPGTRTHQRARSATDLTGAVLGKRFHGRHYTQNALFVASSFLQFQRSSLFTWGILGRKCRWPAQSAFPQIRSAYPQSGYKHLRNRYLIVPAALMRDYMDFRPSRRVTDYSHTCYRGFNLSA